ncbi:30S ribosomal protein S20 [Candidatus Moduliflexus flocculans]|uniref:Small ribosomal subunit protein bS20 n=1 Tax=Candidatus Moduliflexus flocculans TaxID=1499966 RepID=A0A081BNR9_9BACT|nr:30S ribosomal protein S20 [Candidatus Moduliflexus flocculans]
MANHKSAIKKARQDEVRRLRNRMYKTRFKNAAKKVEAALEEKNKDAAKTALQEAISVMDKIVTKGVVHKNTAARKKSRLSLKVNALVASA